MTWVTPTLEELRGINRDNVQSQLRSGPMVPNSVLRVMSDSNAGLAYLTLLYINWLALQLMPDTAETEWLDRFGDIWRPGGSSRKAATFAAGVVALTGLGGMVVPNGTQLSGQVIGGGTGLFQTSGTVTLSGPFPTPANFVSLTAGATGLQPGSPLSLLVGIAGVDGSGSITSIVDGIAEETDDDLRIRVLDRIRQPPMGGDAADYELWALAVPGVTRAWCAPNEMGVGTVTVRIMCDNTRAPGGFPLQADLDAVAAYLDTKRPVAVKDFFVEAPIAEPINFAIGLLDSDNPSTRSAIISSVTAMLAAKARPASSLNGVLVPAQAIFAAWVSEAIMSASGVESFDLTMSDHPMPHNGCMATLGTITYA